MSQPQYILAKYVSELQRNEPRNIGVILWTEHGVVARFHGEGRDGFDSRRLPGWIGSKPACREWISHWRYIIDAKAKESPNESVGVDFLDELIATSKANYALAGKSIVLEEIGPDDVEGLLTFLFETLVQEGGSADSARKNFDVEKVCNRLIKETQASKRPDFHRNKGVMCQINGQVNQILEFNYYLGNGTPERLYHRVALGGSSMEKSVHAAAWMFERVNAADLIAPERSGAVILTSKDMRKTNDYKQAVDVLRTQTRVFDLGVNDQKEQLEQEFNDLGQLPIGH